MLLCQKVPRLTQLQPGYCTLDGTGTSGPHRVCAYSNRYTSCPRVHWRRAALWTMDELMGAAAEDNAAQAGAGASALAEMVQARRLQRRAAQRNLARGTAAGASRELDPAPLMMPHKSTEEARRLLARQAEEARQHRDHQANQQQRKELKRRFAESSESVARRATAKARLDAARLRLALASLLHPRLASHAAIRHEHAPALLDLLFDVATQPPLQFRPVSLSLLTVGHVALVGGGRGGFQLEGVEELPLPAQMPLAELLRSLRDQHRVQDIAFKAHRGQFDSTAASMLGDLDWDQRETERETERGTERDLIQEDRIAAIDESSGLLSTVEQFVGVDGCCLMKIVPLSERSLSCRRDIGRFASHCDSPGRRFLSAGGAENCTSGSLQTLLAAVPSANHAATFRSVVGPVLAPSACTALVQYLDNLKCADDILHIHTQTAPLPSASLSLSLSLSVSLWLSVFLCRTRALIHYLRRFCRRAWQERTK